MNEPRYMRPRDGLSAVIGISNGLILAIILWGILYVAWRGL